MFGSAGVLTRPAGCSDSARPCFGIPPAIAQGQLHSLTDEQRRSVVAVAIPWDCPMPLLHTHDAPRRYLACVRIPLGELVGRRTLTSTQSSRSLEVQLRWPPLGAVSDDCIVAVMGVRLEARCAHGVR
jgi:hypothetical protein